MKIIIWFRNDLRLHDNEVLYKANQKASTVIPVYIFDPRNFKKLDLGFRKTESRRASFLIESVADLRNNLQKSGSNLIVKIGKPEDILPALAEEFGANEVYTSEEVTYEETNVDQKLEENLKSTGKKIVFHWQSTLYHIDDLPFEIRNLPDVFTQFRNKIEKSTKVRAIFKSEILPFETENIGKIPSMKDLGFEENLSIETRGVLDFKGGETAGLQRLQDYLWNQDLLKTYKETRNEMLGADYSSKFSVWLANGCLSPRMIYEEILRYETERVKNDSTYWLVFELIWRDYFRFVALKFGNSLFFSEGIQGKNVGFQHHQRIFQQWIDGETGIPLIDANMKELQLTGFMSNRGRQNVASFLVKDLNIDWVWGAAWFESQLLDYDVCSNWGNWNYVAGVGNDPRENRYFNIHTQATRYDAQGNYVKHWLPELSDVPAEKIHLVGLLTNEEQKRFSVRIGVDYPKPLVNVQKWLKK